MIQLNKLDLKIEILMPGFIKHRVLGPNTLAKMLNVEKQTILEVSGMKGNKNVLLGWGGSSVVECFPSVCRVLGLIPSSRGKKAILEHSMNDYQKQVDKQTNKNLTSL